MTIDNLPLFIDVKIIDNDTGKKTTAQIQTRDFNGVQDAKIGDFAENWYIRPKKATNKIAYKTLGDYKRACTLALKAFDKTVVEYIVEINGNYFTI